MIQRWLSSLPRGRVRVGLPNLDNMALTATDFNFPGQKGVYHGKVRDVYNMGDKLVW